MCNNRTLYIMYSSINPFTAKYVILELIITEILTKVGIIV